MTSPGAAGRVCNRTYGALGWMVLIALGLNFLSACTYPVRREGSPPAGVPVRFLYVDAHAVEVYLVGSFNQWTPEKAHYLERDGETWSVTIMLRPGRHQYAFVVNGHIWKQDPGARFLEDNGFGMMNSVLIIE
jgi:hypothetical protein